MRGRAGVFGRFRRFARMSIELGQRPAPPASAAVRNSSLFAASATAIAPISEAADDGQRRSADRAGSMADDEGDDEGQTVSLDDDESDTVKELPAMKPERRLSNMRRRRSGAHFTLLPAKAQWIDLVLAPPLPAIIPPETFAATTVQPSSGRTSLVKFRTQQCANTTTHACRLPHDGAPSDARNRPGIGVAGAQGDGRD